MIAIRFQLLKLLEKIQNVMLEVIFKSLLKIDLIFTNKNFSPKKISKYNFKDNVEHQDKIQIIVLYY